MSNIPRASLCVTILDDEDYRLLMTRNGGPEAFGVFVAMLVLGRERLQQGKARQVSESDSLVFDNGKGHLLAMTHLSERQLDRCLNTMTEVAKESGCEPWMHLDENSHLVIRSFFKFNTKTGWGGARQGAGRNSSRIQDDSKSNQLDSRGNSSRIPSGTGTGTGTGTRSSERTPEGGASKPSTKKESPEEPGYAEAIKAVREILGDDFAKKLGRDRTGISVKISGQWDCMTAAAAEVARRMSNPKCEEVRSPFGLLVTLAADYAVNGPPPVFTPPPKPKEPCPPYLLPLRRGDEAQPQAPKTYMRAADLKAGTAGA